MKALLASTAIVLAMTAPAMATNTKPTTPTAASSAAASASARLSTKQLNKQSIRSAQATRQSMVGGSQTQSGGGANVEGDRIDGSWGFAYARDPVHIPQATATESVAVTSYGFEVGPLFSYGDQQVHKLPGHTAQLAELTYLASTNDGTRESKYRQAAYLAALCADQPEVAKARFVDGACDDVQGTVNSNYAW